MLETMQALFMSLYSITISKPKAVPIKWLEQHILPKLGETLKQDLKATLDEVKQLPTSLIYQGGSTIIIRVLRIRG